MPLLRTENERNDAEVFSADAQVLPSTANAKDGTIDVVWYSGAAVPRVDRTTSSSHGLQGVPLPRDKPEIAATLALCCEFTGVKAVYLDAGSGAIETVPAKLIEVVRGAISQPLIVGGGVRRPEQAEAAFSAGADVVVVGSAFEGNASSLLFESFGAVAATRRSR